MKEVRTGTKETWGRASCTEFLRREPSWKVQDEQEIRRAGTEGMREEE